MTSEVDNIRQAMRPLRALYGKFPAAEFSPLKLQALREMMIHPNDGSADWSRKNINRAINRIRGMFKWAAAGELVQASVHHGLMAVTGLKAGRCAARETATVQPLADAIIGATLPLLSNVTCAMIQLQRLTGARPGEICAMRIGDIERAGEVWTYRLRQYKTQHHGRQRTIAIGPRAQEVLKPFLLKLRTEAFVFSPADAVAEMRQHRSATRNNTHALISHFALADRAIA